MFFYGFLPMDPPVLANLQKFTFISYGAQSLRTVEYDDCTFAVR